MALTDKTCKFAKPKDKDYTLTDGDGLHLLVKTSGTRIWRISYYADGKRRTHAFGRYPETSLLEARAYCVDFKKKVRAGVDPVEEAERKERLAALAGKTFGEVLQEWYDTWKLGISEDHRLRVWNRLQADVMPALGNTPIAEITPPTILSMLRTIEERDALEIASRARQHVSNVFSYAMAVGYVDHNPVPGLEKAMRKKARVKHFAKVPDREVPELLADIDGYWGDPMTRLALKFTLYTWVRTDEALGARWSEFVDLDGKEPLWCIPETRMKIPRVHLVPLAPQVVELLRQVPRRPESSRFADRDLVFWSERSRDGTLSENTMLYALYRMGYHSRQTIHGFRRLASTWANENVSERPDVVIRRYHEDWIEMQLAHDDKDEVRSAYNEAEYITPRRKMLADWANHVDGLTRIGKRKRQDAKELI